ncbi:hypothetical protein [Staphylococcus simiae]|uniref:Lipoprotein n=1 Tax=Staphylococcus simiae CCM 7213 = CCUG 51256 TaxID=911238 RepID=G5JJW7_9STAP|nr:hypothetical protein [Staphylococcus simiae]EHJ07522.1 hypothetical protein SS7213T_08892 [Staphylococcus simiae CCM 7213 = CCUG 51256]PNZ09846.1 hypothetical protein CD113_11495 [Staphylococcus simiae]SNV75345.1 Uncharacterised protein [Staphylococcus simiae]
MFKFSKSFMMLIVIVVGIVALYGCGKSDIDGKSFKVFHKNKFEATMEFGKNNELTVKSAEGKYNAGQEFRGEYQLKEVDGKQFLLLPKLDSEILDIQTFGYKTVEIDNLNSKDKKDWYVYQLEEKDNKFFMYDLTIKEGKADKFKDINDLNMLEIKKEDDKNDINSILEPNDNVN